MHKIAARPPTHEYGSEVHPYMIVDSPVVRACIGTEGAVGVIGPDRGGNSIHNVGFSDGNPSHGRQAYYIMQPNVLLLPVLRMVTGYDIALTVHKHAYDQCRGCICCHWACPVPSERWPWSSDGLPLVSSLAHGHI